MNTIIKTLYSKHISEYRRWDRLFESFKEHFKDFLNSKGIPSPCEGLLSL